MALQEDRKAFAKKLPDARFFPLDTQSKRPLVKLKGRKLSPRPPANPQYGIALPPNLLVVDVDTHTDDRIDSQIAAMSHLLGTDLTKTLTVVTASGGRHFYVRVPDSVNLEELPNGSLRHLDYLLRRNPGVNELLGDRPLDTDFKLGKPMSVSYTVGPGSYNKRGAYEWIDAPILTVSSAALATFANAKEEHQLLQNKRRRERSRAKAAQNIRSLAPVSVSSSLEVSVDQLTEVPTSRIKDLRRSLTSSVETALSEGRVSSYHSRRAHVFQLMQCCFSDEAIAQACVLLKVDWDSYTDSQIGYGDLLADIARLRAAFPSASFHGVVCGKGRFNTAAAATGTLEEGLEKLTTRVQTRSLSRRESRLSASSRATVVNTSSTEGKLAETIRESSAQFANSMRILHELVQPILNAGSDRVVMSRQFLAETFELTDSQVAKALGSLRRAGILTVRDRQRTGVAPTYSVDPAFVDNEASEILSLERQFRQLGEDVFPALIMDYETRSITEAYTGDMIAGTVKVSAVSLSVARRYCVDEAERREAISSGEYSMKDWENGLDSHDDGSEVFDPVRELFSNPERVADLAASGRLREVERELGIWSNVESDELVRAPVSPGSCVVDSRSLDVSAHGCIPLRVDAAVTDVRPSVRSHEELGVLVV